MFIKPQLSMINEETAADNYIPLNIYIMNIKPKFKRASNGDI